MSSKKTTAFTEGKLFARWGDATGCFFKLPIAMPATPECRRYCDIYAFGNIPFYDTSGFTLKSASECLSNDGNLCGFC